MLLFKGREEFYYNCIQCSKEKGICFTQCGQETKRAPIWKCKIGTEISWQKRWKKHPLHSMFFMSHQLERGGKGGGQTVKNVAVQNGHKGQPAVTRGKECDKHYSQSKLRISLD